MILSNHLLLQFLQFLGYNVIVYTNNNPGMIFVYFYK
ncbi:unnamed protein product [Brassica oleracea]|uniref:(rape) hypothetical protein n=1 Tax=Brassica napus TaxID=3708 RepID=A0A816JVM8_BRANA|nr:unnamed protein product [Brassica napus]